MKNKNLSWVGALFVFALLLWCTAVTPGKVADPATYTCAVYSTFFSLLPPVIAIVLALNTKEVYTSLLVGIASGALLYANGNLELALNTLFFNEDGGMITKLSDSGNVGILAFLVMLGILVALMNKAGGSAAFGRWASTHIHSRAGAQFATLLLGVMIFVDDYFNCLTVGSVMRPVTDRQKVSRAKLAYLIDSTAAPICIIAPVSSWAAAVTSSVPAGSGINGFTMFLRTIPYNYYAVMTVVMSLFLIFTGAEFGPMKLNEDNAKNGDLFTTADRPYGDDVDDGNDTNGHVIDLIAPVLVLIAACIFGMVYTGGFFEGVDFITAFADCNASAGLVLGSSIALLFTFVFYRVRGVMTFQDFAACIPEGFKAMVSPMLILTLAWTLSGMTNLLGAKYYVANLLGGSAAALQYLLPVIIFLVAVFLAFATGTSWGTFSILIPIVCHAFPQGEMLVVSIAACLSGAVCGDHCSPISDTTIMASAGAHCSHVNHVSTQLPYAITAASCSAACYVITGLTQMFLGSSASLAIGDMVVAIGNPLGRLAATETVGYVSGINREVTTDNTVISMLQTDAAINPGNSGGPLFNMYGEVIGITNAKYSSSSSSSTASIDNIGFAIPINHVLSIVKSVIEKGYISKPYVGVSVSDVNQQTQLYGIPAGAAVQAVSDGSPAAEAGLQAGDVITRVNGTEITGSSDLGSLVSEAAIGDMLTMTRHNLQEAGMYNDSRYLLAYKF